MFELLSELIAKYVARNPKLLLRRLVSWRRYDLASCCDSNYWLHRLYSQVRVGSGEVGVSLAVCRSLRWLH